MRANRLVWALVTLATWTAAAFAQPLPPPYLTQWGTAGSGAAQFSAPSFVAFDDSLNVYLTDTNNSRVQKFDANGAYLMQWNTPAGGRPRGIAFEPVSGTLYVADFARDSVIQYSRNGTRMAIAFGGTGTGNGQLRGPSGLVIANSSVYVAEATNNRLQRFSLSGANPFVLSQMGQLAAPYGVAADTAGNVYVTNPPIGAVKRYIGATQSGSWTGWSGASSGGFSSPTGIAFDRSNLMYVVTGGNKVVCGTILVQPQMVLFYQWGMAGSGDGQFSGPNGLALNAGGDVFVVDAGNQRVQKFAGSAIGLTASPSAIVYGQPFTVTATLTPPSATGTVSFAGAPVTPAVISGGVASVTPQNLSAFTVGNHDVSAVYNGDASVGASRSRNLRLTVTLASSDLILTATPNPAGPTQPVICEAKLAPRPPSTLTPNGNVQFAINGANYQAPVATVNGVATLTIPGLQLPSSCTISATFLTSSTFVGSSATIGYARGAQGTAFRRLSMFGSQGSGAGQFNSPAGMAADASGNVYVVDRDNDRVQKFNRNGFYVASFGGNGSGQGQFQIPAGTAVDGAGNLYVSDEFTHLIQKFSSNGASVTQWGGLGSGDGQLSAPHGVAVDGSGSVYVADTGNDRIAKFTSAGAWVSSWGGTGGTAGRFEGPIGVAVDAAGLVYVGDTGNSRIQKFDGSGAFLAQWAMPIGTPSYLAADPSGGIYAPETANSYVEQFNAEGRYLNLWGCCPDGATNLSGPLGAAIDDRGFLYVADSNNHRIQKFAPAAQISRVLDVVNDQGRQVRVTFMNSPMDVEDSPFPVVRYDVFRKIDAAAQARAGVAMRAAIPGPGIMIPGWDFVGSHNAFGETVYEVVVPTLRDSNQTGLNPSTFFVRAATAAPLVFYDSETKSGSSADNLPPLTPAPFVGQPIAAANALHWAASHDADFSLFRLYRGASADFVPGPGNLIVAQSDTGYTDSAAAGTVFYYKLSAVDVNDNESGYATVEVAQPAVTLPAASPLLQLLLAAVLGLSGGLRSMSSRPK